MCGIVGYTGKNDSLPYLIDGLKSLEYRGYDSAGLAVEEKTGIKILKTVGKVTILEKETFKHAPRGNTGLAHTRWATHGKPTKENSHPLTDCFGDIALVHNGIIENYLPFKEELEKSGHIFRSETDTETVAHLLENRLKKFSGDPVLALLEAVRGTVSRLKGTYALAVLWRGAPGTIVATRKKSPLVVGLGKEENFLASDVSAFQDKANLAVYPEDGDTIVIRSSGIKIYGENGEEKNYDAVSLEKFGENGGKDGCEHYMLKEIREQPMTVRATVLSISSDIKSVFGLNENDFKTVSNILLVGCGTAYHATMVARYWIEEFTGVPAQAELASEYKYRKTAFPKGTLAIFVSQSGETADTVAALEKARAEGFKTVSICNVYGSTLSRISDYTFFTKCGQEISVASTKAFTAQLVSLFALAVFMGKAVGNLDGEGSEKLLSELSSIDDAVSAAVLAENDVKKLAEKYFKHKSFVFLGRNVNYPIALEGALKLKEITYLQAEGFAAGEIKHGPIALLNIGTPVVSVMPGDSVFDKMVNACEEVMARGAEAIAVTDERGASMTEVKIKDRIVLKNVPEYLFPIAGVVALQLFAYWIANLNGREIDQPRNLAKSVTVE